MRSYTLHLPRNALPGEPAAIEHATLVRDGFSWTAFLFAPLWFFWHRLWVAGLLVLLGLAALVAAGFALNLRPGLAAVVAILGLALVGLEAASLRSWTLRRRGQPAADVVTARSRLEAESKLVARFADRAAAPSVDRAPAAYRPPAAVPVIGLFPEAERGR